MQNPIGGLVPDFTIFGAEFTEWWQKLFAAGWALAIIIALFFTIRGVVQMSSSDDNPNSYQTGRKSAIRSGLTLVVLIAFGVIVGAIFAVAG